MSIAANDHLFRALGDAVEAIEMLRAALPSNDTLALMLAADKLGDVADHLLAAMGATQ